MKFELPQLPYSFSSLEPVMDAKTVEIHYTKHHQAYVDNLNAAVEKYAYLKNYSLEELLLDLPNLPEDIKTAVRNNGGGHYNHSEFWKMLTPQMGQEPEGKLLDKINHTFGSFENFKTQFENAGKKHFGSGWVWLIENKDGKPEIITLPNQDAPLIYGKPLLGVDLWEHSYYLKYQNKRADYLSNIWQIINWRYVEEKFNQ